MANVRQHLQHTLRERPSLPSRARNNDRVSDLLRDFEGRKEVSAGYGSPQSRNLRKESNQDKEFDYRPHCSGVNEEATIARRRRSSLQKAEKAPITDVNPHNTRSRTRQSNTRIVQEIDSDIVKSV